jgi:hypothetical protein
MHIARMPATAVASKDIAVIVIACIGIGDCVHRLVDICDQVHEKLQRFNSILARRAAVRQHLPKKCNLLYNVISSLPMLPTVNAIPWLVAVGMERNIPEVPVRGFRALCSYLVCPSRDSCEVVVSRQFSYVES